MRCATFSSIHGGDGRGFHAPRHRAGSSLSQTRSKQHDIPYRMCVPLQHEIQCQGKASDVIWYYCIVLMTPLLMSVTDETNVGGVMSVHGTSIVNIAVHLFGFNNICR